ncbi:hypothetical protein BH09PAT1_BH09PAT1_1490 [soil metagenome]
MTNKKSGGLPRYSKTNKTGGKSQPTGTAIKLPKDGGSRSISKGIEGTRHSLTKPNSQGSLKLAGAPKDQLNTTLGKVYIRTKPNK